MVLIPPEPFVSTLILTPIFSACFFNASRAIYVCAIPVGHAVTANTYGSLLSADVVAMLQLLLKLPLLRLPHHHSINNIQYFFSDDAFNKSFRTSSSIKIPDNFANASKCVCAPPSGAAIIKNKCAGCISKL